MRPPPSEVADRRPRESCRRREHQARRCSSAWRFPAQSPWKSRPQYALSSSPGLTSHSFHCWARSCAALQKKSATLNLILSENRAVQASTQAEMISSPQLYFQHLHVAAAILARVLGHSVRESRGRSAASGIPPNCCIFLGCHHLEREYPLHLVPNGLRADRLDHEPVHAGFETLAAALFERVRGHRHNRNMSTGALFHRTDLSRRFHPIQHGHLHVHGNEVDFAFPQDTEYGHSVARHEHLMPHLFPINVRSTVDLRGCHPLPVCAI